MNDSQNKYNDINKKPISATRNTVADVENIIVGVLGAAFFFGLTVFAIVDLNIFLVLGGVALVTMCIAEIYRGLASINNKKLIAANNGTPDEKNQMDSNDKKIKKCNKIKVISLILAIIFIIISLI